MSSNYATRTPKREFELGYLFNGISTNFGLFNAEIGFIHLIWPGLFFQWYFGILDKVLKNAARKLKQLEFPFRLPHCWIYWG